MHVLKLKGVITKELNDNNNKLKCYKKLKINKQDYVEVNNLNPWVEIQFRVD